MSWFSDTPSTTRDWPATPAWPCDVSGVNPGWPAASQPRGYNNWVEWIISADFNEQFKSCTSVDWSHNMHAYFWANTAKFQWNDCYWECSIHNIMKGCIQLQAASTASKIWLRLRLWPGELLRDTGSCQTHSTQPSQAAKLSYTLPCYPLRPTTLHSSCKWENASRAMWWLLRLITSITTQTDSAKMPFRHNLSLYHFDYTLRGGLSIGAEIKETGP